MRSRLFLLCVFIIMIVFSVVPQNNSNVDIAGYWEGSLNVGAASLKLAFLVQHEGEGYKATMDSPDQSAYGIPVAAVVFDGHDVKFDVSVAAAIYSGNLSADATTLKGVWNQGGREFPLDLTKSAIAQVSAPKLERPQTPVPPFPYLVSEVRFPGGADGITLAGTLTTPVSSSPVPAVVLITGSGAQDRDETIFSHKPFFVIADYLSRRGIAVLRYDDRGIGASGGDFASGTTFDFALDAEAALSYLATVPGISPSALGMVGHSEGGLIASICGSRSSLLDFIVLLAGPGMNGVDTLLTQSAAILEAGGASDVAIAEARRMNTILYDIALQDDPAPELRGKVISALVDNVPLPPGDAALRAQVEKEAETMADQLLHPWFRTFISIDPAEYLAKVRLPVLALFGEKDLQVVAEGNSAKVREALDSAGNQVYSIQILPGLNHLFQTAGSGSPDEYGQISETISPTALELMGTWILQQAF